MNKNILYTVKGVAGCLLMASLAAGCAQEDIDTAPSGGGGMSASSYVSLSFASQQSTPTRSNPTGGETGDGQEKGQNYENEIKSAVAFFYQGSGSYGVNSIGTTPIMAVATFNIGSYTEPGNGIDRTYKTTPQQVDLDDGTYNVLVVANPGTDWWTGKSLTLAEVRNHIQTTAWTASGSDYSDFVMTSAADATLTLNSNPESDPAKATVDVERMAARLDYKAEASYTCTDPAYTGATVEITGAALVNNLTAGSYLLKRVADDVNGTNLSYLGNETAAENGAATNYVLDPWTANKNGNLYGTWFMNSSSDPNWWAGYVLPGTSVSDGAETWQRIGYTLENTTAADAAGSDYSTGVVFKATFHPQGVANYQDGATFFVLGTHLFASMEDMMTYVYGADFSQFDAKIDACDNWAAVKTFAASLLDNDPSGYKEFLNEQLNGKDESIALTEEEKAGLKWSAYMLSNCGYSASLNETYKVELDQNGIVTRNALQSYGVRTYEDATCYYTWWVRHSNDNNDDTKGIMEYAIVRNNIYKLTVSSIYSLGNDVPGEDENIILDVYVNDWLLLEPETLPM
ncbi:Mfa1 family fimbria major subunit [uncultured Prevotella sp.]|uniref:Mfa1 family fimbria major subunit n=1 Tax=uncultured Prevotella sp. TaxID=159272 RepID=UPI00261CC83D|nr:Mfa1 family fimbria major subunit [uncultured Prevotella sp.]